MSRKILSLLVAVLMVAAGPAETVFAGEDVLILEAQEEKTGLDVEEYGELILEEEENASDTEEEAAVPEASGPQNDTVAGIVIESVEEVPSDHTAFSAAEDETEEEQTEEETEEEGQTEEETEEESETDEDFALILEEETEGEEALLPGGYEADAGEEEESEMTEDESEEETEEDLYGIETLAATASGSCGTNAAWSLDSNGTLTISGSGATTDYTSSGSRPDWESSKSSIVSVVIESGITKIGDWTFYNHYNIKSVTIASSVTSFGKSVFAKCSGLTSITLPSGVTEIPYAMFADCTSLTSLSAPGVTSYGDYAFQNVRMDTFTVGKKVTSISYIAFFSASIGNFAVESGNSVYSASDGVLFTDSGRTLVMYPAGNTRTSYSMSGSVTKIADGAFNNCSYLQQVSIGSKVTYIGESAFQQSGITSLTIPDSVTEAGYFAFYNCSNLQSVKFGSGLKETSYEMFEECYSLTDINFGSKLESLDARTFAYCTSLTAVSLPSNVKSVGNGVFGECRKLKSFSCKGLTSIPYQAFCNTTSLSDVSLGEGLTTINRYAFCGCTSLMRVVLPSTITFVHADAFDSWTELVQSGTSLTPFGTNGLRMTETVSVTGTRDYTKAFEVLDIVNTRRAENGLSKLVMNESLMETAMKRAAELSVVFSHTRPDGSSCLSANSLMVGENAAYGSTTASAVMSGWMNSSGHKQNILSESYTTIGVGCFEIDGAYYWIQCFGTGTDSKNCSKPSNRSVTESIGIATETFDEASTTSGVIFNLGTSTSSYTYSLQVKLDKSSIDINDTAKATVYLKNPGNSALTKIGGTFTWKSSKTSVATVKSGKVTGVAKGSSNISATTQKGYYTAKEKISVSSNVALSKAKITSLKNKAKGVLIEWGKVSGAKGYYVYRKTNSTSYKKIAKVKGASTLSYKDTSVKNKNGTKYSYKVIPYSGDTVGTGKAAVIVRLSGTTLSSLKNNAKSSATVKWNQSKKAGGYQIQYSTSKSFAKNKKKVTVSNASKTKKVLSGLKKGKTYYVRIRTYKKSGGVVYYSAWSTAAKVKIKK